MSINKCKNSGWTSAQDEERMKSSLKDWLSTAPRLPSEKSEKSTASPSSDHDASDNMYDSDLVMESDDLV